MPMTPTSNRPPSPSPLVSKPQKMSWLFLTPMASQAPGNWDQANGVLTLTGSATKAQYEAALESVTYNNTSGNPNTANRTISWVVNDGDSNSAAVTSTITVAAVNDAPTVSDAAGTLAFTENDGASVIDSTLTISDADDTNIESATITISSGFQTTEDVLAFSDANGITGTWNHQRRLLTLTGSATKAQYEAALESVTYNNTSDDPNTANRTISWVVNDGTPFQPRSHPPSPSPLSMTHPPSRMQPALSPSQKTMVPLSLIQPSPSPMPMTPTSNRPPSPSPLVSKPQKMSSLSLMPMASQAPWNASNGVSNPHRVRHQSATTRRLSNPSPTTTPPTIPIPPIAPSLGSSMTATPIPPRSLPPSPSRLLMTHPSSRMQPALSPSQKAMAPLSSTPPSPSPMPMTPTSNRPPSPSPPVSNPQKMSSLSPMPMASQAPGMHPPAS